MELCLQSAEAPARDAMARELCAPGAVARLLHDQYGNYVVQRALGVCSLSAARALVDAMRPHLPSIASTAGGRRIVARILTKFPALAAEFAELPAAGPPVA